MSTRRTYQFTPWHPGDPLYIRPESHTQGNHIRPLIQLLDENDRDHCNCTDAVSWPAPFGVHDLDKPADTSAAAEAARRAA